MAALSGFRCSCRQTMTDTNVYQASECDLWLAGALEHMSDLRQVYKSRLTSFLLFVIFVTL